MTSAIYASLIAIERWLARLEREVRNLRADVEKIRSQRSSGQV